MVIDIRKSTVNFASLVLTLTLTLTDIIIENVRGGLFRLRFLKWAWRCQRRQLRGKVFHFLEPLNALDTCYSTIFCCDRTLCMLLIEKVLYDMRKAFSFHNGGFRCLHSFTECRVPLPIFFNKWMKYSRLTLVKAKWYHFAETISKNI